MESAKYYFDVLEVYFLIILFFIPLSDSVTSLCNSVNSYYTKNHREDTKFHKVKIFIMIENDLSKKIIGYAIEVHKQLGPGLLESA